jgi:mRNA-degrading endonuclease RelE of RelBE toxin-antitoxin system
MKEGDKFEVEYSEYALDFLKKADKQLKKRIVKKIECLAKNISVDVKHRQTKLQNTTIVANCNR